MGYREMRIALGPDAFRPQNDIEIERARLPWLAAPYPPEMMLNMLQSSQELWRCQLCRHNRCGIGILTARWPQWRAGYRRGLGKDVDIVHLECGNGLVEYLVWTANQGK